MIEAHGRAGHRDAEGQEAGTATADVCRQHGGSSATVYTFKARCREDRFQVCRRGGRQRALGTRRPMLVPETVNRPRSLPPRHGRSDRRRNNGSISAAVTDGRRFRVLAIVDGVSRECLALVADTSLSGHRAPRPRWSGRPTRSARDDRLRQRHGTDREGDPRLGAGGAVSTGPASRRADPCRTVSSSASTAACATSFAMRCWSRACVTPGTRSAAGTTTTTTARTPASGISRRSSVPGRTGWTCAQLGPRNRPADSPDIRRRAGPRVSL